MKSSLKNKMLCGQRGFTLVEIAIVLIIVGSMISISISAFLSYEERTKVRVTKQRLAVIQESMTKFLEINGRYPCPVSFALRPEDQGAGVNTTFGIESNSAAAGGQSCRFTGPVAVGGTVQGIRNDVDGLSPTGNLIGDTRIGAVPVRTLNLPDEFAVDAWGSLLSYAVVVTQATEGEFFHDGGDIRIRDDIGDSVISPADSAHYIVVSYGRDQLGARVAESNNAGAVKHPCNVATDPTPLQRENCDDDATFIISPAIDDLAVFDVQRRRDNILPLGTVLAFDSSDCPQGWIEYMGQNGNRGRFLMGLDDGPTPRNLISPAPTVKQIFDGTVPGMVDVIENRGNVTDEYQLGDMGESGVENIPPYLALRYCAKQ